VAEHSQEIAGRSNVAPAIPVKVVFQDRAGHAGSGDGTLPGGKQRREVHRPDHLVPHVSPSKMWINGLKQLRKPVAHLHTQYNRDIPWATIDMDFMNMNQAAHGDREHGFIWSRLRLNRKVVVGFWQEKSTQEKLGAWARAAAAWADWQTAKFCRFGDNMREVAVTEGDKVSAQIKFGFAVNGHGVGDLVKVVNEVSEKAIDTLVKTYEATYEMSGDLKKGGKRHKSVREAARIELGLRAFLTAGGFKGFTTTFEDLHGLVQLPGLAPQRLMADGYGFAGEGDWKTAALVRAMKVMASGLKGGTSFMEDYTYHLHPGARWCSVHTCWRFVRASRTAGFVAGASARHRRQGRPGAARFQHARGAGAERGADGFRQPFPPAHQRSGCRQTGTADAETARRPGRLEVPSEF